MSKRQKRPPRRAGREQARKASRRDEQGRVHLVIERDAYGRPYALALSRPLFNEQWQNEVATGAAGTTHGLLGQGHTQQNAVAVARSAMAGTSKIAEGAIALSKERTVACRQGCAHCCYQAVGVTAPEVLAIFAHLRETLDEEELAARLQRIQEADDRTRGMSIEQRLSPDLPCPLLVDERCSIYEVRPLACRGKNSLDAEACERTLNDPESRRQFLAGTLAVPCFLEPIRAVHAVSAGMQLALTQLERLEARPLELTAALRILADDPERVTASWLAGENPFQAARGGDISYDPRIRELTGRRDA